MFFFRKILERQIATGVFFKVGWFSLHCIALHYTTPQVHSYAMMNISEERQAQHQSYWCHLLEEETESPTINTYPNLFSKSKEEEAEAEEEEEEEDSNGTCRRQYTCFQCNVTISLISSSSSPLLLCPHCYAEFWEELEPLSLSSSLSTTSNNPDLNSTPDINDVPEQDEGRYGNSLTVAVTERKKKKSEKEWRRVIFHKIRTFFGFAI